MSYQDFKNRHPVGSVIDTDGYPKNNPFQCVDVPKAYLHEESGVDPKGTFGPAAAWATPNGTLRAAMEHAGFTWIDTKTVQEGDITPLSGINGNRDGHIGIADGDQDGDHFLMLEQNGSTGSGKGQGADKIRTRMIPKSRLLGVWRHTAATAHEETVSSGRSWYIRTEANANAPIVGTVLRGDTLRTEPLGNSWRRLLDGRGYVSGKAFEGLVSPDNVHKEVVKNGQTWYVRQKPDPKSAIVGVIKLGDVFETEVIDGGWRKLKDGPNGYVGPRAW